MMDFHMSHSRDAKVSWVRLSVAKGLAAGNLRLAQLPSYSGGFRAQIAFAAADLAHRRGLARMYRLFWGSLLSTLMSESFNAQSSLTLNPSRNIRSSMQIVASRITRVARFPAGR